jgi:AraC-like DNA-binding protein
MPVAQRPQVDTHDLDEARKRLSDIYCPHKLTMSGGGRGFECRQTAWGTGPMRIFDLLYGGSEVRVDPVPFDDFVLVTRPLRGRFAVRSAAEGLVTTADRALVMDAYGSYQLRWHDNCRVLNIALDRRGVEKVAAELRGYDEPRPVRFDLAAPESAVAWRRWASVSRFLVEEMRAPGGADSSPLLRGQLFRMVVAALLETYRTTFDPGVPGPASASSAAMRRAMSYMDLHAAEDIGLLEIASAARLSVRGLQAAFQRSNSTTPLGYLRQTRLRQAHAELRAHEPHETTVAAVASRWGFTNLSRFAAEHRAEYGCSPSDVLRRG